MVHDYERGLGTLMAAARNGIVFLALLLCVQASGQRLLVQTTTSTPAREPVATQVHLVDIGHMFSLPDFITLPGTVATGMPLVTPDGAVAIFTAGPRPSAQDADTGAASRGHALACNIFPFHPLQGGKLSSSPGGAFRGTALGHDAGDGVGLIAVLGTERNGEGALEGRLEVYEYAGGKDPFFGSRRGSWPLPGLPVGAVVLEDGRTACILSKGVGRPDAVLQARDLVSGEVVCDSKWIANPTIQFGANPSGLARSRDSSHLFVLTSGYALGRPSGEAISQLNVLDAATFEPAAEALQIVGSAEFAPQSLQVAADGALWIATRSPGTDFAYATCARPVGNRLETLVHVPFTGVPGPLLIATAPTGKAVAIAAGNRLELWMDGRPGDAPTSYSSRIGALTWTEEGLFLGEGGRIHRVLLENRHKLKRGIPERTLQLQTGWVSGITPLNPQHAKAGDVDGDGLTEREESALGTSPSMPDSDRDGISDAMDPEPMTPSPRIREHKAIVFHGEAVGRELRTILLDQKHAEGSTWRLEYSEEDMPWLLAYPRQGKLPDRSRIFLGIFPALYNPAPGEEFSGTLTLHMSGTRPETRAAGSPASIEVRIAPDRNTLRRVLWIWDNAMAPSLRSPGGAHRLGPLADLLAAPPHRFSHREARGPLVEALAPYTVVVLGTEAASHGAMTRQALLDYVAGGGALLLLGSYSEAPESQALSRWLSPVGIYLDPSRRVDGRFATHADHALCLHWENFEIRGGCAVRVDDAASALVRGPGEEGPVILAQREYGLGRIVVLASQTPLEKTALTREANRRFASDLFTWLARARQEINDQDGDGLPDATEDRNDNGRVDFGESDYLNADSDGDGLPDSKEDLNRNGWVEAGETSPLNADSDGDGISDGADIFPLPPADAPYVGSVEPATGPGEGGTFVIVTGRNLSANTTLWFGNRRSPHVRAVDSTRLVAVTPGYASRGNGTVEVRAVNEAEALEGSLLQGFHYAPRSIVKATLRSLGITEGLYGVYEGSVSIELDCPEAEVGRGTLLFSARPADGVSFLDVVPSAHAERSQRRIVGTEIAPGLLQVDISPGAPGKKLGVIAVVRWKARTKDEERSLTFSINLARVKARNGATLRVAPASIDVQLVGRAARAQLLSP